MVGNPPLSCKQTAAETHLVRSCNATFVRLNDLILYQSRQLLA